MQDKNESDIWDVYIQSNIVDANSDSIIWAGPNADELPLPTPVHVITAYNPFEQKLSEEENTERNDRLFKRLKSLQVEINPVIGCSPDASWQELSFAIYGLTRIQACAQASEFGQRGIFELTHTEVFVIEVNSQNIMRQKPRVAG